MSTLKFNRDIAVRHDVDIFVGGGGPAGVAAALAAARNGRTVYIAEGTGSFGGMGTAGMVPAFMEFGDGERFIAAGIGREVYDGLWDGGGTGPRDKRDNPYHVCAINAEVLKRVYDDLVLAEPNIAFTFFTQVLGIEMDDSRRVTHAVCQGKSGLFAVRAKMFVDGTGDGDIAAWAGAEFEKGDAEGNLMPGTLCSQFCDIDWQAPRDEETQSQAVERAIADGIFSKPDRHVPGIWPTGTHTGGGNIGHAFGVDGTDERSLTPAMVESRKLLLEYLRFFREYRTGFDKMELTGSGALMGIRETRRIIGDYVTTVEDFKSRAVFDDEIGRYCYPVDIHASRPSKETYAAFMEEYMTLRYERGESYGISYRILQPRGLPNVLVAGRCISADRPMQASVRVMPGCYITGQAAGVAAALACDSEQDSRKISVAELQQRLKKLGAYLPNAK